MSYTKGRWEADGVWVKTDGIKDGYNVIAVCVYTKYTAGDTNAHLIAAAPSLYEALKAVEWADSIGFCPICEGDERGEGHAPGCTLRAALDMVEETK